MAFCILESSPHVLAQLLVAFTFLLLVIILHFCRIFHFGRLDAKITVVEQFDFMTVSTQLAFISNENCSSS